MVFIKYFQLWYINSFKNTANNLFNAIYLLLILIKCINIYLQTRVPKDIIHNL